MNKQSLLRFGDILMLSILLVVSIIGFIALGVASGVPAKIVSGILGVGALVGMVLYFLIARLFPYLKARSSVRTTKHGVNLYFSPLTKNISTEQVESWTEWLINFWNLAMGWSPEKIQKILEGVTVDFNDIEYFQDDVTNRKVKAYTLVEEKYSRISTIPQKHTIFTPETLSENLFKHEVSHIIAGTVDPQYRDEEKSHKLFIEVKLGV